MVDRRPAGFNVDLGFYDSDEVLSIPRKHRAAAVGVWALCGAYAASRLTDGLVSAEKLKELGCTPAIKAALMETKPEPLWISSNEHPGAIQFTRWRKWQRTRAEVKGYREAEAERKRREREAKKDDDQDTNHAPDTHQPSANQAATDDQPSANQATDESQSTKDIELTQGLDNHQDYGSTSGDNEMSGRTSGGHEADVQPDDGTPRGPARPRQSKSESESEKNSQLTLVEGGPGGDPKLPVAAKPAPGNPRGTRLPTNWEPPDDTIREMRDRFPAINLRVEHEKFTNHWRAQPGAKGRKSDWEATWRNWILRAAEQAPRNGNHINAPPGIGKPTQKALGHRAAGAELLAEMEQP